MAYLKPQSPIKNGENHIYPLTTHDQIILADGSRWDGKLVLEQVANLFTQTHKIVLTVDGWNDTVPYIQTINIEGLMANDLINVDIDMSEATNSTAGAIQEAWCLVGRSVVTEGAITFYCYDTKPEMDLKVNIQVIRQSYDDLTYAEEANF